MKRIFLLLVTLFSAALTGCDKPKVIPDSELAMIFHDVYLTNAYIQREGIRVDSLQVYEPIFEKYGYTVEDLHRTINNFSKRKSARLSDVVEQAIKMLESESDRLNAAVADLDTIDNIARRTFARVIHFDSVIRVRAVRDTLHTRLEIPVAHEGDYQVDYYYYIDSTDKNTNYRTAGYLLDRNDKRSGYYSVRYRRPIRDKYSHTFTADTSDRSLVIDLLLTGDGFRNPNFTIDSLTVTYYLPREVGRDSLTARDFGFRLLREGFYEPAPIEDSALYMAEPPRIR